MARETYRGCKDRGYRVQSGALYSRPAGMLGGRVYRVEEVTYLIRKTLKVKTVFPRTIG